MPQYHVSNADDWTENVNFTEQFFNESYNQQLKTEVD